MTALIVGVACLFSTLLIYSGTVISFLRFEHTLLFVGLSLIHISCKAC